MPPKSMKVVEPVPGPIASARYEATRLSILKDFAASVPENLLLPSSIIENPPKNVTKIPRTCGLLSPTEIEITEKYDAVALAAAIACKTFSATVVAKAFAKRAIIAHQLSACLTEWFMDEALEQAKELDDILEKTGKTVGPLHGVPISVKGHIALCGHTSILGFLDSRFKAEEDSLMVAIFRKAGAVFYCKTNQPQALMHLESCSPHGRTLNPHNIYLSAGGSSGGEAALIALRGSVFGIGTDIGGSVRGPAGFCGIYGFKPTSYTLPMKGFLPGGFGAELQVLAAPGPMCTSLRDMDLFMSVVLSARPYIEDPRVIPIPWTGLSSKLNLNGRPLKIGFMMNDGFIIPQPPITRALEWARSQLQKSPAFEVKTFLPFQTRKAMMDLMGVYWPDGGKVLKEHLAASDEPMYPLTQWVLNIAEGKELTANEILKQRVERDDFRCKFSEHWESQDVDVVICPLFVGPAPTHDTAYYLNYTAFWNYVDYPGAVVPTPTTALRKGGEDYPSSEPLGNECSHVRQLWAEGDFEDAPINLQIMGRRYHDNSLFASLGMLKEALHLQ
ncbi:amidase signature domain-containing protein [Trichoderma velutinum]